MYNLIKIGPNGLHQLDLFYWICEYRSKPRSIKAFTLLEREAARLVISQIKGHPDPVALATEVTVKTDSMDEAETARLARAALVAEYPMMAGDYEEYGLESVSGALIAVRHTTEKSYDGFSSKITTAFWAVREEWRSRLTGLVGFIYSTCEALDDEEFRQAFADWYSGPLLSAGLEMTAVDVAMTNARAEEIREQNRGEILWRMEMARPARNESLNLQDLRKFWP